MPSSMQAARAGAPPCPAPQQCRPPTCRSPAHLRRPQKRPAIHAGVLGRASDQAAPGSAGAAAAAAQRGTQPPADFSTAQASELGIPAELLPRHVAIIMDGNSRWAAARGLPAALGHQRGVEALRAVVRACHHWGVPCLTVYAFSCENWARPAAEVDALLALMERVLAGEAAELAARGVRLRFIGELGQLPASLQAQIRSAELATADNSGLHLTVALSYSGRRDLTLAVQELVRQAAAGQLLPADVTPAALAAQLATRQLPPPWRDPDLVIRTSGEQRLSNFLCWETAYSELHFSDALWPDWTEAHLAAALRDYAGRERRFGGRRGGGGGDSSRGGGSHGSSSSSSGGGSLR